jgi:hypothetical protein
MRTVRDYENHPLFGLASARYNNADVAFALDLPNFTDWRKSEERAGFLNLPRRDDNPARPAYRLGHVYEFALKQELNRHMSRESAFVVLRAALSRVAARAMTFSGGRIENLDEEMRDLIKGDDFAREAGTATALENYALLVSYPLIGFDPEMLDRSPERFANPVMWVIAPDAGATNGTIYRIVGDDDGTVEKITGSASFIAGLDALTTMSRNVQDLPGNYRSCVALNVTGLLSDIDTKLTKRLNARRLKGDTD